MKGITNQMVLEAAEEHALVQLGNAQYSNNKDAVETIANDFIAGFKKCLELVKSEDELIDLVDTDLMYQS